MSDTLHGQNRSEATASTSDF